MASPEMPVPNFDEMVWETVARESGIKVVFDTVGDVFTGMYEGEEHIAPENGDEPFDLYNFTGTDGRLYSVNKSYKLGRAMGGVTPGKWVRITYVQDIPTRKAEPMKDFRVDVAK